VTSSDPAGLAKGTTLLWRNRILTRTITLTLTISLVPLLIVGAATVYYVGKDAEHKAEEKLLATVAEVTNHIDNYLTGMSEDMAFIVMHIDREDLRNTMNSRLLSAFASSHPDMHTIWAVNNEGQKTVLFSRSEMIVSEQTDTHAYSRDSSLEGGGVVWHGTEQDIFGEHFAIASIPIKQPWQIRSCGLMFFKLQLEGVQKSLSLFIPEGAGEAFIVNDSGQLIAHTDRSQVLAGADMLSLHTEIKQMIEGDSYGLSPQVFSHDEPGTKGFIASFNKLPSLKWGVVVEKGRAQVYRMRDRLIWLTAGGFIIIIALVMPLAVLFSYRLTNPIGHLMKTATELAAGKPNARAEVRTQDEIGLFAETFNMMVDMQQKIGMELAEEKERLLVTLRSIGDAVIATDTDGKILLLNRVAEELTGWEIGYAVGRPLLEVFNIISEETREPCLNPVEKVLEAGIVVGLANHTALIARDGSEKSIADSGAPIQDRDGNIIGVVLVFRDITEQKLIEEKIRQGEQFSKLLLNSTAEAIYGIDTSGLCTFVNPSCLKMLGYENEADILGKNMHDLIHHTKKDGSVYMQDDCRIYSAYKIGQNIHIDDEVFWRADGTSFPVEYWSHPITQKSEIKGAVVTFLDITQRKEHEHEIIESLKEKEVLLREIHHRVKNNMAIILSLLKMQSAYIKDPKDLEMFQESQGRIRAMALVHEKLYKAHSFAEINVPEYLGSLAESIKLTFPGHNKVEVRLDIADVYLNIDMLLPFGLIINELLTNSFKHAFDESNEPEIGIELGIVNSKEIQLSIKDNGKGLPEGFDINQETGLGLQLVTALCQQIRGTLEYKSGNGSLFTLTFPIGIPFARA
jgi:PAS domain S-box-containing protein